MKQKMRSIRIKPSEKHEGEPMIVYGKLEIGNFYALAVWTNGRFIDIDNPENEDKITHWILLLDLIQEP